MEVRVEDSFETLSQEEWDKYLDTEIFDNMFFKPGTLGESSDIFQNLTRPRLHELIQEHNDKVGSLCITYALCKHYYDKGIPDVPWYISPGKEGQSVQLFPNFNKEHWMRKYWFNYFADTFYLKISSTWDSLVTIIDEYYCYSITQDLRFRSNVFKKLKDDNPNLLNLFNTVKNDQIYRDANNYRTAAAHGTSASEVSNAVDVKRDVLVEFPEIVNGETVKKTAKATRVISVSVGKYTYVQTIMENIENYARFSGEKMQEAIKLMENDSAR